MNALKTAVRTNESAAQQTLLDAQLAVAEYKFDEIQGVISLYRALGGGTH